MLDKLRFLLDHGADPHLSAGTYGFPLQAACAAYDDTAKSTSTLREARVRTLLELRPDIDVNAPGGLFGCALQAAAYSNQYNSVKLLLSKGADVNHIGGLFECALQAAAYSGQINSVKLPLSKGAHVNHIGGKYGSALTAAVVKGCWDAVAVLLEAGAKPDCWYPKRPDEEWLRRVQEEDGRGAVERYQKFREKQLQKASR